MPMNLKPAWLLYQYLHVMQFDMHKAMMHNKLNRISADLTGRWLDIGAGDQPYKKFFANAGEYLTTNTKRHYTADDIERLNPLTTYWIEDGKALPVADHSLDGVACFQVLSVIDKPEAFFKEISRVLKPGGKLLLTTDLLYPVWSSEDRFRHTAFNLRDLSEKNGFGKAETESFGAYGAMNYALFMRYLRLFPELWKRKKNIAKISSIVPYILVLILLPIISLKGIIIFLLEKNSTRYTDFTFNIFLTATKSKS
jgi:SAM-dependent methyltransferase